MMAMINLDAFATSDILDAIDHLDRMRALLADTDFGEPSLRDELIKLHKLALNAESDDAPELANHAFEVECEVGNIFEAAESLQSVLMKITDAVYDGDDDWN